MSTPFPVKVKTFLQSIVTYAAVATTVISVILLQVQSSDLLPDNWVEPVVTYGGIALTAITAVVTVIKRVMPVPEEGAVVRPVGSDPKKAEVVFRGWE